MTRPLLLHVWGVGRVWRGRVAARLGKTGRWRKVRPELGREAEAGSAKVAAMKALTAYARERRTCRRCGAEWEAMRRSKRRLCPSCHNHRREDAAPANG